MVFLLRHNLTVESFFTYRVWDPKNYRRASDYIQRHESISLLSWLNRDKNPPEIDNKIQFETTCRKHGIPTPEILAVCSQNGVELKTDQLPGNDLFSKPVNLWLGIGAQAWRYDKEKSAWRHKDLVLQQDGLLQYLYDCCQNNNSSILVQTNLVNGKPIDQLTKGALSTFRIVTFKHPNQKAKHYKSVLKMPTGYTDIDYSLTSGLAAGIDDNGVLKAACAPYQGFIYLDSHPDSGSRITGTHLQCWQEVVELAIKSHDLLTNIISVGWDIAWTTSGPVVIEGNTVWGPDIVQLAYGGPLGQDFCDLFLTAANK